MMDEKAQVFNTYFQRTLGYGVLENFTDLLFFLTAILTVVATAVYVYRQQQSVDSESSMYLVESVKGILIGMFGMCLMLALINFL